MHGENLKLILKYYLVVNECYSKVCVCDITISCASSVFMWLYIQSLVAVACVLVWPDSNLRPTKHEAGLVTTTSQFFLCSGHRTSRYNSSK